MSNRNNAWETDYDDYGRNRGRYGNRDNDYDQERRTGGGYSRDYGGYGTGNYSRDYDTSGARYRGSMAGNQSGYGANDYGADYNDRYGYRGDRNDRGMDRGRYGGSYYGSGSNYGGGGGYDGRDNWSAYNEGDYGRRSNRYSDQYGRGRNERNDRDWWDRAGDEVASWFGDDEAERRRRMDERRNRGGQYAGRGPKGYQRSDDRIREDVNDRLTDNSYLDASDIEVDVNDGIVKLSGHAEDRQAKRLAEDLAENVSGVKDVDNNIRVNDQNWNDNDTENRTVSSAANQ